MVGILRNARCADTRGSAEVRRARSFRSGSRCWRWRSHFSAEREHGLTSESTQSVRLLWIRRSFGVRWPRSRRGLIPRSSIRAIPGAARLVGRHMVLVSRPPAFTLLTADRDLTACGVQISSAGLLEATRILGIPIQLNSPLHSLESPFDKQLDIHYPSPTNLLGHGLIYLW